MGNKVFVSRIVLLLTGMEWDGMGWDGMGGEGGEGYGILRNTLIIQNK